MFVITSRVGWDWEGITKLETDGDQAGTQLLKQRSMQMLGDQNKKQNSDAKIGLMLFT